MQCSTRDCVAWELTERWRRVAWTKWGFLFCITFIPFRNAFACTSGSGITNKSSNQTEKDENPQGTNQQACKKCGRPIAKSCFLFPCGHCLHMECAPEHRPRRCPCGQKEFFFIIKFYLETEDKDSLRGRSDKANLNEQKITKSHLERGPTEKEKSTCSPIFNGNIFPPIQDVQSVPYLVVWSGTSS